jgi:hypothetical protein
MGLTGSLKRAVPRPLRRRLRRLIEGGPSAPRSSPRSWVCDLLPPGSTGVEIGVWQGDFSALLLERVRPEALHLVDPWKFEQAGPYDEAMYGQAGAGDQQAMDAVHDRVCARFAGEIAAGQVIIHRAASAEAASSFRPDELDWVYIDGNHLYEFVHADLTAWGPLVERGGHLICDDYGVPGWWDDGVTRAVEEFAARADWDLVRVSDAQAVLRRVA